jgi:serine phosphatase RsbU (regulator of sigma subunit)/anti-sigma regulatory factor (Ser/Thr protein kinase)
MTDDARLDLAPELDSPSAARRFVAARLAEWSLGSLVEDVELVTTELVTNAVLHARAALVVRMERRGDGVRVEVHDLSRHGPSVAPPFPFEPDEIDDVDAMLAAENMTGRGLHMVSVVADSWGVAPEPDGKVIWAEVGTGNTGLEVVALPAPTMSERGEVPELHPVRLVGVPVRLALESDTNLDDLLREFQVLQLAEAPATALPSDLLAIVEEVLDRYAEPRLAGRDVARQAANESLRLFDVGFGVPDGTVEDMRHLTEVLDQVATYCREGTLLSLAPSDELRAFRRWWVDEVARQVNGSAPTPCPFRVMPKKGQARSLDGDRPADLLTASSQTHDSESGRRLQTLQEVTGRLARAVGSEEVADILLRQGVAAMGGTTASLCMLAADGETVEIVHQVGYPEEVTSHWQTFPVSADLPASEAIRTGEIVVLRSMTERYERYPAFLGTPVLDDPGLACVPLAVDPERVLGAIAVSFPEREISEADLTFLAALATQGAQALDRALLLDSAAEVHGRFAFLAEASLALGSSLDVDELMSAVVTFAVPRLADWSSLHIADDSGNPVFVTAAHTDPEKRDLALALNRDYPIQRGQPSIGKCLVDGEPALFQVIPEQVLAQVARDARHLDLMLRLGFGSAMVVPLVSGGRVLGVLALANETGRVISETEYRLAQDLGARAGAALANAQLFAERSHVARALQASLLPTRLPRSPEFEFAGRYVAAGKGMEVGGDFYDVFRVDDGWVAAIGDVCGKGVEAAAVTGLARHTIRAIALLGHAPASVLVHLNDVLLVSEADALLGEDEPGRLEPRFCTVALAHLTRTSTGARAVISVGGHPLPLVVRASGAVGEVGEIGDLLGLMPDVSVQDVIVDLGPGDAMVLVTDGVLERHERTRFFGESGLLDAVREAGVSDATSLARAIEARAVAFVEGAPADDMAVLVVRVPG